MTAPALASIPLPGQATAVTWRRVSGGASGWVISSMNASQMVEQLTTKLRLEVIAQLTKHPRARNVLGVAE